MKKILLLGMTASLIFMGCGEDTEDDHDHDGDELHGVPEAVHEYKTWLKMNADTIPFEEGDAHQGSKEIYVNMALSDLVADGEQQFPFPDGTIIVKEGIAPDTDYIGFIAIMTKTAGAVPDHNDWVFEKYSRDSADDDFTLLGQGPPNGEGCVGCHVNAADTDYAFTPLDFVTTQ